MNDSLKVIELLRYNLNTNVERVAEKVLKERRDSSDDTFSAVFATGLSLVSCEIGAALYSLFRSFGFAENIVKSIPGDSVRHLIGALAKVLFIILFFLAFFFVTYFLVKKIRSSITKRKYENKVYGNDDSDFKRYIDDFDHTACDALLFTRSFLDQYNEGQDQKELFNLYEAMYYLGKAQSITSIVLKHPEECIGSTVDTRIDEHRLTNAIKMMEELKNDIDEKIKKASILGKAEKESLNHTQERLTETMKSLTEKAKLLTGETE